MYTKSIEIIVSNTSKESQDSVRFTSKKESSRNKAYSIQSKSS